MKPVLAQAEAYDYLILSVEPWQTVVGCNARDISRVLAQTGRVLFVNPPHDWSTRLRPGSEKSRLLRTAATQRLVEVEPNTWVLHPKTTLCSVNWLPDNRLYDGFNWLNNALLAREIRWALAELGMQKYVLFNDSEMYRGFYLAELLKPSFYTYYIRDDTMVVDYWRRHGERLEPALMRKADLVVANSAHLRAVAARSNPNAVDVGQGCDLSNFVADTSYPEPSDLVTLPRPRIGYAGALTAMRLDMALLEALATARPHWQLVLIGKEDAAFRRSRLHSLPNVHFLGSKPIGQLPAYLQHVDVLINPQVLNALTIGNYPRKVDEYLAMGKPVVATHTQAMEAFREHVLLAETPLQFIDQIQSALSNQEPSSREARVRFAQGHSWKNSVTAIQQAVADSLPTAAFSSR